MIIGLIISAIVIASIGWLATSDDKEDVQGLPDEHLMQSYLSRLAIGQTDNEYGREMKRRNAIK